MEIKKRIRPHSHWDVVLGDGSKGEILTTNEGTYWSAVCRFARTRYGYATKYQATGDTEIGAMLMLGRVLGRRGAEHFKELSLRIEKEGPDIGDPENNANKSGKGG